MPEACRRKLWPTDMDRTYISTLERGLYSASIDTVAKLAEVLGVEPDELLQRLPKPPRG